MFWIWGEGGGGKAKDIGGQGLGKGVNFKLAGNRLAGWKPFKQARLSFPADIKKIEFCESMSCWYYNVFANICPKPKVFFNKPEISYFYPSQNLFPNGNGIAR